MSLNEKVFDPQAKHDLALGREALVRKHRGNMFLVVGHQVCSFHSK